MYIGVHVNYASCLSDVNETWPSRQIFEKYRNITFNVNRSSRSMPLDGRTDSQRGRRTNITKLMAAFRNFAKST